MISIIVVSLNTAKKFEKTIKSILNQSTNNFELIIVDGLSKDKTKYYLKKYKKKITKIISEKDKGIYDAMNKGIKKSSKKWIYFLNSGDIFYNKNVLKKVINLLKKLDSHDILVGNSFVKKSSLIYKSPRKPISNDNLGSSFSHQASFVKSKLLKKKLFKLKYKFAADFDFFLNMYNSKKKFFYINDVISLNLSDGISDTFKVKVVKEFREISLFFKNTVKKRFLFNLLIFYFNIIHILKKILPDNLLYYLLKLKNKIF
jgi:glycosyltransferase involved in cell wall biosynthesis